MAALIWYRCSDSHACIRPLRCHPYLVQTENMKGRPFGALFLQGANGLQVGWRSKIGTIYPTHQEHHVCGSSAPVQRFNALAILQGSRHSMHDSWMRSSQKPGAS